MYCVEGSSCEIGLVENCGGGDAFCTSCHLDIHDFNYLKRDIALDGCVQELLPEPACGAEDAGEWGIPANAGGRNS